ncbi:uncharacterized protein H6S33_001627 [Morchella sextelata]|uniref:uncharacterized protein n=1 Tax=Morchella sextelata TaxID=1174677 RepID=UPI001D0540A1|nr:uncharacterized protein H6S33_001627 [Morchella sextelata]KAH0608493.1 hypothetical protein H6S33_001627 [Morchella sextelata]
MPPMDPFTHLGDFEIAPIIELLDPIDIIRLQGVSRTWYRLLASEYIARIALISHFPRTAEAVEFRESLPNPHSVVLPYRRAAYRFHTRRLGLPTRVHEVLLDCSDEASIEWDAADGYAAWTSHEDRVLRVQSLEGDKRILVALDPLCLDGGVVKMSDLVRARMNVQMGKGLLVVTLNFYDSPTDGYGFGRRALILVFAIPSARLLWKLPILLPQRLLGEVDFAQDRLTYIRKTPITHHRAILHFVAHNILTGETLLETELERSSEISNGDQFFVMVTDRPFKRLIILHEDTDALPSLWGPVFVRVFSINDGPPGRLLAKYDLKHSPFLGNRFGDRAFVESDLYMDYPPKGEVFWIVESCFVFIDKRPPPPPCPGHPATCACTYTYDSDTDTAVTPSTVSFSAWSVQPNPTAPAGFEMVQSIYRSIIDEGKDFQRRFRIPADDTAVPANVPRAGAAATTAVAAVEKKEAFRDRCQRFEIFLPEEQCSATFYNVKPSGDTGPMRRFRIDVGSYRSAGVGTGGERVMVQSGRMVVRVAGGGGRAWRSVEGGVVEVRGEVYNEFLHGVQWSERHLALRTRWREEGRVVAAIVVFDFGCLW